MIPRKLIMRNFLSHVWSTIDFDKFNAALIVGAHNNNPEESNGAGKCLSPNTILTNPNTGERISILELYKSNKPFFVSGMTDNFKLIPVKVKAVAKTGTKKMLKITMSNGKSETISKTHPIYTSSGIRVAEDIKIGDWVAQPRVIYTKRSENKLNIEQARLLGIYIAEGGLIGDIKFTNMDSQIISIIKSDLMSQFNLSTTQSGITFSVKNNNDIKAVRKEIIHRLNELGCELKTIFGKNLNRALALKSGASIEKIETLNDPTLNKLIRLQRPKLFLKRFLQENNLFNKKSINKCIPKAIFEAEMAVIKAFVGILWSVDGFISDVKNDRIEVSIGLGSEQLIDDIQSLLLTFGILSTKRFKKVKNRYNSWTLTVNNNYTNIIKFHNAFINDIYGVKRTKLESLINIVPRNSNTNIDIIPNNLYYKDIINSKGFASYKNGFSMTKKQLAQHNLSRKSLAKYAEFLKSEHLMSLSKSDLIWRKIKAIEDAGIMETYDIEIDSANHLYALDGFITHNSAILEAIRWVLFDKSRHKKKDGVVKRDASVCEVEFDFEVDNILYKVIRKRNKVVGEGEVRLEQWDGSQFTKIECDTNTITDNKIIEIINFNHEVFTNSVYFKQGDISVFTRSTPSKRKDILKALLKLDKWDDYQKQAKKHLGKLNTQIEGKKSNIADAVLLANDLEVYSSKVKQLKKDLKRKNDEFSTINNQLLQIKYQIQSIPDDANQQLNKLETEYNEARKRVREIKLTIEKNEEKIFKNSSNLEDYIEKLNNIKKLIKDSQNIDLEKARGGLIKGYSKSKFMKEKITTLQKKITDKECDTCLRSISSKELEMIAKLRADKLQLLKEEYQKLTDKIKKSEQKFNSMESVVKAGSDAKIQKSAIETQILNIKNNLKIIALNNNAIEEEMKKLLSRKYSKEIEELRRKYSKERLEKLQDQEKKLSSQLDDVKKSIDKLNVEYGSSISTKKELANKQKMQTELQKEIDTLSDDYRIYDKLKNLFGKDGIQSVIIENVIDELENYTNTTLSKICNEPTSIKIKMQRQSENGSWTETFDIEVNVGNRQDEFEALSGGEQFRISLALRLALSKILSKRMGGEVRFLLLDEVSSSLDEKGLVMFANIVKQLSNEMKIMIITHDNRLKDYFEDIITVEKDANGSKANI